LSKIITVGAEQIRLGKQTTFKKKPTLITASKKHL